MHSIIEGDLNIGFGLYFRIMRLNRYNFLKNGILFILH